MHATAKLFLDVTVNLEVAERQRRELDDKIRVLENEKTELESRMKGIMPMGSSDAYVFDGNVVIVRRAGVSVVRIVKAPDVQSESSSGLGGSIGSPPNVTGTDVPTFHS